MMNANRAKKNNDCEHQQSQREHDHEHQQSLGEQQPCTPLEPKESSSMNITKNKRKHEGHTMKSEDHHCMLRDLPLPSLPLPLPQVCKQDKEKKINSNFANTNRNDESNGQEHQ